MSGDQHPYSGDAHIDMIFRETSSFEDRTWNWMANKKMDMVKGLLKGNQK